MFSRDLVYANGEPYFETYLDSIWDLYVLVTTANSPDVMWVLNMHAHIRYSKHVRQMKYRYYTKGRRFWLLCCFVGFRMPAYDYSNWFALFFIFYIVICWLIFMSIVLAAIYYSYRKNLKVSVIVGGYYETLNSTFSTLQLLVNLHLVGNDKYMFLQSTNTFILCVDLSRISHPNKS